MIKITGLTNLQVQAIRAGIEAGDIVADLRATTAIFYTEQRDAYQAVKDFQSKMGRENGTRGGHYQSLHAVLRKLSA